MGIYGGSSFMKTMHVVVEDYNPKWKIEFEKLKMN